MFHNIFNLPYIKNFRKAQAIIWLYWVMDNLREYKPNSSILDINKCLKSYHLIHKIKFVALNLKAVSNINEGSLDLTLLNNFLNQEIIEYHNALFGEDVLLDRNICKSLDLDEKIDFLYFLISRYNPESLEEICHTTGAKRLFDIYDILENKHQYEEFWENFLNK